MPQTLRPQKDWVDQTSNVAVAVAVAAAGRLGMEQRDWAAVEPSLPFELLEEQQHH